MSKRDIFEIGFRLFGLYLLFQVPFHLLNVGLAFAHDPTKFYTNIFLYRFVIVLAPLMLLVLSLLFIFKGAALAAFFTPGDKTNIASTDSGHSVFSRLPFWIVLIGLFYIISSASSFIGDIIKLPAGSPSWYWWGSAVSHAVTGALALIFIFRSNKVVEIIKKYSAEGGDN